MIDGGKVTCWMNQWVKMGNIIVIIVVRPFPLSLFDWMFSIYLGWQLLSSAYFAFHVMVCVKAPGKSAISTTAPLHKSRQGKETGLGRRKGKSSILRWQFRFRKQNEKKLVAAISQLLSPSTLNLTLKMYLHLFLSVYHPYLSS